jgi:hypothetical protein
MRFLLVVSFVAVAKASQKRGFVGDGGLRGTPEALTGAHWYYAYNTADPFSAGASPHPQFVPMYWCFSNATVPRGTNLTFFMGYNEPNDVHSCNKSSFRRSRRANQRRSLTPTCSRTTQAHATWRWRGGL